MDTHTLQYEAAAISAAGVNRRSGAELCQQTGAALLIFLLSVVSLIVGALMLGASLSPLTAWLALLGGASLTFALARQLFETSWYVWLVCALLIFVALLVSVLIHDTSIDGQHYHFQAIYALTHGWNPFWSTGSPPTVGDPASLWVLHYPMASWVIQAALVAIGLPLEASKCVNWIALFASSLVLLSALLRLGLNWWVASLVMAATSLNPVVIAELFTRMNDGFLASLILIFVISVAQWMAINDRLSLVTAAASLLLAINLKFSALPILIVLSAFAVGGVLLHGGRRKAVELALILSALGVIAVFVLGAAPYGTNLLRSGNAFYPLMGAGSVDIMKGNTPDILQPLSAPARFLFSLFAESHSGYEKAAALKWPFSFSLGEIRAAGGVDVRIAGFGPLFSGIILLAALALPLLAFGRTRDPRIVGLTLVAAAVFASVLLMPQNWWARYVPQFWLVPCLIAAALLMSKETWMRSYGYVLIFLLLTNVAVVAASSVALAAKRSTLVNAQLTELKHQSVPYCVSGGLAQSRLALFQAAGIEVRGTDPQSQPTCASPVTIAAYGPDRNGGWICPCPAK